MPLPPYRTGGGKTLDKRVCNDKGEFDFKLPADNDSLQVCITFIGFEPLTVTVPKGGEQLDLGNLKMVESSTELGAVTVKAEAGPTALITSRIKP